jgi:hypothetical protein
MPLSNKAKIILSLLEVFWCLLEYIFLLLFTWFCWSWLTQKKWLPDLNNKKTASDNVDVDTNFIQLVNDWPQLLTGFVVSLIETSIVIMFLLFRYRNSLNSSHGPLPPL